MIYIHFPTAADLIITMFEGANSMKPSSEDVLSHLFMSYVRTSDYKKQKDVALQLYKLNEQTPSYLWAVMSVVMQVSAQVRSGPTRSRDRVFTRPRQLGEERRRASGFTVRRTEGPSYGDGRTYS